MDALEIKLTSSDLVCVIYTYHIVQDPPEDTAVDIDTLRGY
jgi:hypothetical protein